MAERSEAARRDPLERIERALNSLGATIIGSLDELVERGGDDLLRRVRTAQGHLATVERALEGASASGRPNTEEVST